MRGGVQRCGFGFGDYGLGASTVTETGRVRIRAVQILSDDWSVLKKTTSDFLRRDGTWQTQNRETYDRGNGAAILLITGNAGPSCSRDSFAFLHM